MHYPNPWTYEQVQPTLEQAQALIEAAELHGLQCGLFIKHPSNRVQTLYKRVELELGAKELPQIDALIEGLFAQIKSQLGHLECDFQLLLPDNEQALNERFKALNRWCHGFLYGMKLGGLKEVEMSKGLSLEAFRVLMDIAAWHNTAPETQEDEKALIELIEFVRMAVQTLYIELNAENWNSISSPEIHTWH